VQALKLATSNLVHKLGLRSKLPKQLLRPNLAEVWARGTPNNFGTPYLFWLLLNLTTSSLVYNLSLRSKLPKITFRTKIGGVWVREASEKLGTP